MKILFYSPVQLLEGGGCERWHCDVTASIKKQTGYEVQIVTANMGRKQWTKEYLQKQLQVPYHVIQFPIIFGALIPTPNAFFHLLKYFRDADVIHIIQGFIGQDIFILLLKFLTKKKIVVGHHAPIFHTVTLHNWYMKYVTRYLLNFFDGHMTLNSADKKYLEQRWGIKNVHFIPSGIRIEQFLKVQRKKHNTLNFITVGIYRAQKGMDLLVQAVEKFNQKIRDNRAVFRLAGGGMQKEFITKFAKRNPNIIDCGYVSYHDMPELYEQTDVYLLSSREEPFGLVLIEGWSSGIPALATETEGPLDMLVANKNGWFIEEISVDGIYNSLVKLYTKWEKSPTAFLKMERDCRQTGRNYSIDRTAASMVKLFSA